MLIFDEYLQAILNFHASPRLNLPLFIAFSRCILDGRYQQAIGMAVECRRLDKLEEAITRSDNVHGTLSYCINVSHSFVNRREYRREVREFWMCLGTATTCLSLYLSSDILIPNLFFFHFFPVIKPLIQRKQ